MQQELPQVLQTYKTVHTSNKNFRKKIGIGVNAQLRCIISTFSTKLSKEACYQLRVGKLQTDGCLFLLAQKNQHPPNSSSAMHSTKGWIKHSRVSLDTNSTGHFPLLPQSLLLYLERQKVYWRDL